MNNRGNINLGDEIRNVVQDALSNRNFSRLNHDIRHIVNGALDEVKRSMDWNKADNQEWNHRAWKVNEYPNSNSEDTQGWSCNNNRHEEYNGNSYNSYAQKEENLNQKKYRNNNMNNYNNTYRNGYRQSKPSSKPGNFTVPVGKISGTLLTVFGSIGSILFGIASIVLALIGYSLGIGILYRIITFILLPGFITGMVLLLNGSRIRKRLKRYQRYTAQLHCRNYCMIKELSSVTGRSNKYIAKDLQKMIDVGMFPEGHIDDKKSCFMLNNESYEQYLKLLENMRMKEMEEQARNKEETSNQKQKPEDKYSGTDKLNPEIRKAINEGRQYVQKIRNANIEIPGEEISRKLDRLEEITGKIYDYIETHPEKFPEIKKFTEYFLPTTLKLVDAYREFDYQPDIGENISNAKKEIEETMDTINHAFENLFDGLFEDAAMDISTDISVLETMLAQEGLAKKNGKI